MAFDSSFTPMPDPEHQTNGAMAAPSKFDAAFSPEFSSPNAATNEAGNSPYSKIQDLVRSDAGANTPSDLTHTVARMATEGALAGPVLGSAIRGVQGTIAAAKAAKVAAQLRELNAAQDAAHIQKVAEAIQPYSWNGIPGQVEGAGQRIARWLREDAQRAATDESEPFGGVPWKKPGALPRAPQDLTELPAKDAANAAMDASSRQTVKQVLKSPWFWGVVAGPTAYHAGRVIKHLSTIFGD